LKAAEERLIRNMYQTSYRNTIGAEDSRKYIFEERQGKTIKEQFENSKSTQPVTQD